jgi:R3H domain
VGSSSGEREEVLSSYELLEQRIRRELSEFQDDTSRLELHFEPMDKDGRYVVHDVANDFPELVSAGVGEDDDRHVVVYRKGGGHVPEGVVPQFEAPKGLLNKRKTKTKDSLFGRAIDADVIQRATGVEVVKANPNDEIRDRRTIEEIQQVSGVVY